MEENLEYIEQNKKNARTVKRVAAVTLSVNIVLTILKLTVGALYSNMAVLSDAFHSLSDVGTTVIVIIAVVLSKPDEDRQHNYGHEKIEPLMVLLFAVVLLAVGGTLVWQGVSGIITPKEVEINYVLIAVTAVSIAVKEGMYWFVIHFAKKIHSTTLKADAWHNRSDSLSSIAVLIGLVVGIFVGTDIVESVAVLIVALMIFKVAIDVGISSINQLIDKAVDEKTEKELRQIVSETEGVEGIDSFRTRLFGSAVYIDVEVRVDPALTVIAAHDIAEEVHCRLERQDFCPVKHCSVHINPDTEHPNCKTLRNDIE